MEKQGYNYDKLAVFLLCILFTFAGIVNTFFPEYLLSLPFMGLLIYIAIKWGNYYRIAVIALTVLVFIPLHFLKTGDSKLYFPSIGQKIQLTEDACYPNYGFRDSRMEMCTPDSGYYSKNSFIIPKGTVFTISRIEIGGLPGGFYHLWAYPDFPIKYLDEIYITAPEKELHPNLFTFKDGRYLTKETVRERDIFYYAPLLLWLAIPVFIGLMVYLIQNKKAFSS